MIFPGFPGALSFFQVFQVEWEPCERKHFRMGTHEHNLSLKFLLFLLFTNLR